MWLSEIKDIGKVLRIDDNRNVIRDFEIVGKIKATKTRKCKTRKF
jgi:accessory colonization factor AcfC